MAVDRGVRLPASERFRLYTDTVAKCNACAEHGLLHPAVHPTPDVRIARPLFQRDAVFGHSVLFVAEAPTWEITFDRKGHVGLPESEADDDETDRQCRRMLAAVGLDPAGVLFTNVALCLPAPKDGKYPVHAEQAKLCAPNLRKLIDDMNPRVVVTLGGVALDGVRRVESHHFQLARDAGTLHDWYGRKLLPLYHPSRLGRITRPAERQIEDIRAILPALG